MNTQPFTYQGRLLCDSQSGGFRATTLLLADITDEFGNPRALADVLSEQWTGKEVDAHYPYPAFSVDLTIERTDAPTDEFGNLTHSTWGDE